MPERYFELKKIMMIVGFVLAVVPVYAPSVRPQKFVLICPKCNSRIPVDCKFCPECGADLRPKKTLVRK